MINKLLENKLRSFIPLNAKGLIIHLYFYLGSNGTISNLKNKTHYPLKSGLILRTLNEFRKVFSTEKQFDLMKSHIICFTVINL